MPNVPKWMADLMETALSSKMPVFEVVGADWISPEIRSVVFKGDLQKLKLMPGYAVSFRVSPTAFRNYTPAFIDPQENIFQILAHIHGKGPGARFFADLSLGQQIPVSMARGRKIQEAAAQYFLFGDESTVGLACILQAHFQQLGKHFSTLLHLGQSQNDLPAALGLGSYELVQREAESDNKSSMVSAPGFTILDAAVMPKWDDAQFILAGNGLYIQRIKKELLGLGIDRRRIHAEPYWVPGKTGL